MVDFVTDSSIKVTGAYKEKRQRQAVILSLSSNLLFHRRCKQVCISRPHNQRNCCLSESWTELRSDSFRKECVWLGGNCGPTSCVNILSVPSNLSLPASLFMSVSLPGSASPTLPPGSSPVSPSLISSVSPPLSLFSFIYILSLQPSLHTPSPPPFPPPLQSSSARAQAGRQASRLGAQMVLWRVSQLWVSEPAGWQDSPSVADMAEASPGTCLWLWTSRGTARLALRENRASTQQTGGLTAEGLTSTLTCDLAAVLLMTTRRCTEYEIEEKLSWFRPLSITLRWSNPYMLLLLRTHSAFKFRYCNRLETFLPFFQDLRLMLFAPSTMLIHN